MNRRSKFETRISPHPPLSPQRLCHNEENTMFVILNPSPFVILSETKGLDFRLRVNSVKNLIISTESIIEILRLSPQNDITTQSLRKGCDDRRGFRK
jgi:hypothetical protein